MGTMPMRVLVVEDDLDIQQLVARYLRKAGFEVEVAASGRDALRLIGERPPDLLVLDLMLPEVDGIEICRRVRATQQTAELPIVMLTARAEEADRIAGLEIGADDYISKPFSPNELVARVRALLRRSTGALGGNAAMSYGSIVVDPQKHLVSSTAGQVTLTAKEYLLLEYLLRHRGRVLSRDVLLTDVWGYRYTGGTRTVDVHVRRLREKLPELADALLTIKQFGYKLAERPPDQGGTGND
jgi:two-component system, OmpR family, alkaline phosphatase synthesis response regulator PhoP